MVVIVEPLVESSQRNYVPLRRVNWRGVLLGFVILTSCLIVYRQLDFVANGEYRSPLLTSLEESAGALAGLLVFPLIYLTAIRFPVVSPFRWRNLLIHLAAVCVISIIHTTLIAGLRAVLFPLAGVHQGYGILLWRYPMEFAHLFIFYWLGIGLIYLFHEIRFAREREIRQSKLEASLAEAQLQNLRLQLEPHFLFNALNAISAAIYEDPRAADEMIGRLGELLRQLLKQDRSQEIPLAREVELLQLYIRVMEARLEHRLKLSLEIEEQAQRVLVPQLILQPLVENAIRHGMDPVTFEVKIAIEARRENDFLRLSVRDWGPGIEPSAVIKYGIGLNNTMKRLESLYGNRQTFKIQNAAGGGAIAEIRIPYRISSEDVPAPKKTEAAEHAMA